MSEINVIHTPCRGCSFAIYEENTQKDCALGFLEIYKTLDKAEILEAYDDDIEFFIINNKKCFGYKTKKYFENRNMQDATMEEKVAYVKDKMKMSYVLVVDVRGMPETSFKNILKTLKEKTTPPAGIVVATHNTNPVGAANFYEAILKSGIDCKWRLKSLSEAKEDFATVLHRVITEGAQDCTFVLSVDTNGYENIAEIVEKGNEIVYKNFETFITISNKTRGVKLFNINVYLQSLKMGTDILENEQANMII